MNKLSRRLASIPATARARGGMAELINQTTMLEALVIMQPGLLHTSRFRMRRKVVKAEADASCHQSPQR